MSTQTPKKIANQLASSGNIKQAAMRAIDPITMCIN